MLNNYDSSETSNARGKECTTYGSENIHFLANGHLLPVKSATELATSLRIAFIHTREKILIRHVGAVKTKHTYSREIWFYHGSAGEHGKNFVPF